ncbi:MAG: L,D-transpeptidase family protein [Pseudomonadota bacterium]
MRSVRFLSACLALLVGAGALGDEEMHLPETPADQVPAYLIQLPASVESVLIANSANSELLRVANDGAFPVVERRYMSVGTRGVGKERSGDRKTPLGVYFMTEELDTRRLDPKYGAAAFVLDYPNAWDRIQARTGHGIWLHGVHPATPVRPPLDTDGCLALPNAELLDLKPSLALHEMPVIVTRQLQWSTRKRVADLRVALNAAVEGWRASLAAGDVYTHLRHYHPDFTARGMTKPEWARFRTASLAARPATDVTIDELMLLKDPEEPDLFLARFRQTFTREDGEVSLIKRLYWRRDSTGFRIVAEDAG